LSKDDDGHFLDALMYSTQPMRPKFGVPNVSADKPPTVDLTEAEFKHVVAVLAEDVVGLAEETAANLIEEAIVRDYRVEIKNGKYAIPMAQPPFGIRADRKLSVSFKVIFDIDDILKARSRKLREKPEVARHLILEPEAEETEKENDGKK